MIKLITKPITLKYENRDFFLPEEVKDDIGKYWSTLVRKNPNLFNGENHCVEKVEEFENEIQMTVVRTNYATYLYNENVGMPDKKYNIIHIWSGILLETLDNYLVIGEMDESTSVPRCLQIPGGGTSNEDIIDGKMDILLNLKRELKEELNLELNDVNCKMKYIECPSKERSVYGFIAVGKLNMTKNELKEHFNEFQKYIEKHNLEKEFSNLVFLNKDNATKELDSLDNPKREYLKELVYKYCNN